MIAQLSSQVLAGYTRSIKRTSQYCTLRYPATFSLECLKLQRWNLAGYYNTFFKDTSYVWGKKQQNLQLLNILSCYSANKPSFQNLTKSLSSLPIPCIHCLSKRFQILTVQNVQKSQILLFFAWYIASILKLQTNTVGYPVTWQMETNTCDVFTAVKQDILF